MTPREKIITAIFAVGAIFAIFFIGVPIWGLYWRVVRRFWGF